MELELYKFRGQDKSFVMEDIYRCSNTVFCTLSVDETNTEMDIYQRVLKKITKTLDNDTHVLRAKQYDQNNYYYTNEKSKQLAKKIVKIHDKELDYITMSRLLVKSELSCIIRIYKNNIHIGLTHLFHDGINIVKIFTILLDKEIMDTSIIPEFKYYPIITELSILPKTFQLLSNIPKRNLSYDLDYKKHPLPIFHKKYLTKKSKIFEIKRYLENNNNGKFGYGATLAVISALFLLKYTTKNTLSIGLINAFTNSSIQRFNHFSACILIIQRPSNWASFSFMEKIQNVSKQVNHALLSYGKEQSMLFYLFTNIYEFDFYTNNYVDCICSCSPVKFPVMYNKKEAHIENILMLQTSMPLYIGYWTCNDTIHMTLYSRSYDIKVKESSKYIIDTIAEKIKKISN